MLDSLVTWNVNSIAARLPVVVRWLEAHRPGVLCLQEIKCIEEKFPVADFVRLGYQTVAYGQPTYNGVATLVRDDLAATIEEVQKGFVGEGAEAHRRLLAVRLGGVWVVNVYVPNGQAVGSDKYVYKLDWLARLRAFLDQGYDSAQPLALCGDFNVAPDPLDVYDSTQWEGKILFSLPERAALGEVKAWGLHDAFRLHHPDKVEFSWWDYRQASFRRNLGLRIDHIWLSEPLLKLCQDVTIDPEPRTWERPSDHTPVIARFGPI